MELIKANITIPDVIRRTYIETYRACPFKFLKEVIEGNTQPPTSYTQIGIDLHEIFEEACKDRKTNDKPYALAQMKEKFEQYPSSLFKSGYASDNPNEMWKRTENSIDTFYDVVLPTLPIKPFTTEETIEFSVGENLPNVQFTMDRIDEVNGELNMHDWKTGRIMVGKKLSSDFQAPLYIYGTREHFKKPVRSFTFYYLNENKTRTFTRTDNPDIYECIVNKRTYKISLSDTIKQIQHLFSQIVKGNYNIPTDVKNMHFTCKTCHIKSMGLCEGADLQVWHNQKGVYAWT